MGRVHRRGVDRHVFGDCTKRVGMELIRRRDMNGRARTKGVVEAEQIDHAVIHQRARRGRRGLLAPHSDLVGRRKRARKMAVGDEVEDDGWTVPTMRGNPTAALFQSVLNSVGGIYSSRLHGFDEISGEEYGPAGHDHRPDHVDDHAPLKRVAPGRVAQARTQQRPDETAPAIPGDAYAGGREVMPAGELLVLQSRSEIAVDRVLVVHQVSASPVHRPGDRNLLSNDLLWRGGSGP